MIRILKLTFDFWPLLCAELPPAVARGLPLWLGRMRFSVAASLAAGRGLWAHWLQKQQLRGSGGWAP